ncbi:MAG: hypothetical protein A2020_08370 [Lentisphaerae bacterium GWF2_45_14]|nr:MAG: hypothetical protein A2020_08370 [Lentisphaerae bacterium GWF2_45_14]
MNFPSIGITAMEKELSRLRHVTSGKLHLHPSSVLIFAIDKDNTVLWANDKAAELFGKDFLEKKCYSLCHGNKTPCKNCIAKAVINDGHTRRHKKIIKTSHKKNSAFLVSVSAEKYDDNGSITTAALKVMIEIPHEIPVFNSKVLVAEDNKTNQKLIIKILKSLGCEVCIAENGAELLERFMLDSYDIIFTDIEMPGMNGYQAALELRKLKEKDGEKIPVVAISAYHPETCEKKCLDSGMNEFIPKPFNKDDIIKSLKKHIRPWGNT